MDHAVLGQALSLAALIAATAEYSRIVHRRTDLREERRASAEAGLRGLVRVLAADEEVRSRRSSAG
jgi:hypothetical protein